MRLKGELRYLEPSDIDLPDKVFHKRELLSLL